MSVKNFTIMTANHRSVKIGLAIFTTMCWVCSNSVIHAATSPTVHIKNGTLEGTFMKSRTGREIVAFRGIPYAQPPLGELRFKPTKPFGSWTGVRPAKEDANMCPQRDPFTHQERIVGDEDCLYINVYSPKLPSNESDTRRTNYPVMISIHGGGWVAGGSHSSMLGPGFLLDHDIVLVTANYRLGPLGFLSTEDLVSPGNQGMKDQAQSIRWVNENIAAFGGDPNRVTIFGESAGAVSVHYHMVSPLSKGLFQRAISQSGTVLCPWALTRPGNARKNAHKLGKLLKCPTEDSIALIDCLRKKDPADIIATDKAFQIFDYCPAIPFRVVIELDHPGAFLTEEPAQLLKSGNIVDIPWMTGITSHEGALKVSGIYGRKDKAYDKLLEEKFMELAPMSLLYEHTCPDKLMDNVTKSIREFYLGDKKIDESTRMNLIDMYTDAWFYIGADNAVRDHLEALSSPVYYYYFAYKGSSSLSVLFGDAERDYGVAHGDDLLYLFPMGELLFPDTPLNKEDHKMVDVMTRLWVNFAKSGNPTPERTSEIPVKWKPVRTSRLEYFQIGGSKSLGMAADLFAERVNFWGSIPHRGKINVVRDAERIRDEL